MLVSWVRNWIYRIPKLVVQKWVRPFQPLDCSSIHCPSPINWPSNSGVWYWPGVIGVSSSWSGWEIWTVIGAGPFGRTCGEYTTFMALTILNIFEDCKILEINYLRFSNNFQRIFEILKNRQNFFRASIFFFLDPEFCTVLKIVKLLSFQTIFEALIKFRSLRALERIFQILKKLIIFRPYKNFRNVEIFTIQNKFGDFSKN